MGYKSFKNTECEYFPCHKGIKESEFNCLFCYCPLYALGENCGGKYTYKNPENIKDCSGCTIPHDEKNYEYIVSKLDEIVGLMKK